GKKIEVFGKSHLDAIAQENGLPILARLPIDPKIAEAYDNGQMETVLTDALKDAIEAIKAQ
ncbi:MAG: P-loop NTPase, partial [Peptoniphilaceae bacterium]|nr:P-loop NTPase [Peptoniphilaceae bacterium]MDY5765548.1 P-loop NTPase [Peptoniphilaceae bacterium]